MKFLSKPRDILLGIEKIAFTSLLSEIEIKKMVLQLRLDRYLVNKVFVLICFVALVLSSKKKLIITSGVKLSAYFLLYATK